MTSCCDRAAIFTCDLVPLLLYRQPEQLIWQLARHLCFPAMRYGLAFVSLGSQGPLLAHISKQSLAVTFTCTV